LADDGRPWVRLFWTRWDIAGDPALWLRLALTVVVPAVVVAVLLARAFPAVAARLAAALADRRAVLVAAAVAAMAVTYAAVAVLGSRAVDFDESTYVWQSKVFARGVLAAPAPPLPTEGDVTTAFFRAKTEAIRDGRWFSIYTPLHPALLAVAGRLGWPKLFGLLAAGITVLLVGATARRAAGPFGGGVAAVLVATSPFFIFTQASFLSETTFIAFFAAALWAAHRLNDRRSWGASILLGAAAGGAFLTREFPAAVAALPLTVYLCRRGVAGPRRWWLAAAGGCAPFIIAWGWYNYAQTGNPFVVTHQFGVKPFGFDEIYTAGMGVAGVLRNGFVLSVDGFGWPLVGLVPAAARLCMKPRPDRFEWALVAVAAALVAGNFLARNPGIAYGARYYYVAWLAGVFLSARFFVILGERLSRPGRPGAGVSAAILAALVVVNLSCYMPRAAARYAGRPWGNYSLWADDAARRAIKQLGLAKAVVIISPREWCYSSIPGSPFLDDDVLFARDGGPRNVELKKAFPGRTIYKLDYGLFRRTGEIIELDFGAGGETRPPRPAPGG
jgi:hypothetical protein